MKNRSSWPCGLQDKYFFLYIVIFIVCSLNACNLNRERNEQLIFLTSRIACRLSPYLDKCFFLYVTLVVCFLHYLLARGVLRSDRATSKCFKCLWGPETTLNDRAFRIFEIIIWQSSQIWN